MGLGQWAWGFRGLGQKGIRLKAKDWGKWSWGFRGIKAGINPSPCSSSYLNSQLLLLTNHKTCKPAAHYLGNWRHSVYYTPKTRKKKKKKTQNSGLFRCQGLQRPPKPQTFLG